MHVLQLADPAAKEVFDEKTWERMQSLMSEQPGGTANYDRLIELFYDLDAAK